MARFPRLTVLNRIIEQGVVPIFYQGDVEVATEIVAACIRGGANVVEFTNRGDFAYQVFDALVKHFAVAEPDLILGVGSVSDPGTAALYINNGANFVVGPVLNPDVARVCNRRKVAYLPGCGTLSEISYAEELGAEIVKIFPGKSLGGPSFVKAVRAPHPWTSIMPTGGVDATRESIAEWLKAGAVCLGMGSRLIAKDLVARRDFDAIAERVSKVLAWVREVRAEIKGSASG